jgi:hypothetical protein
VPIIVEITSTPAPTEPPATGTPEPSPTADAGPSPTAAKLLGGGGRIVFVSDRADRRFLQLWTMNPDGTDPVQLTFGPDNNKTTLVSRWPPPYTANREGSCRLS